MKTTLETGLTEDGPVPVVGFDWDAVYRHLDGEREQDAFDVAGEAVRFLVAWLSRPITRRGLGAGMVRAAAIRLLAVAYVLDPPAVRGATVRRLAAACGVTPSRFTDVLREVRCELGVSAVASKSVSARLAMQMAAQRRSHPADHGRRRMKKRGKKQATARDLTRKRP